MDVLIADPVESPSRTGSFAYPLETRWDSLRGRLGREKPRATAAARNRGLPRRRERALVRTIDASYAMAS